MRPPHSNLFPGSSVSSGEGSETPITLPAASAESLPSPAIDGDADPSHHHSPELTDVAQAVLGDRAAFERVYRTHVGRVMGLCLRMCGDRMLAEELTQDTFVRAWHKLPTFRGESAFGTWLYKLTVNVVLDYRRTTRRDQSRVEQLEDSEGDGNGAAHIPMDVDRIALRAAIDRLPPGAKAVFALHDVEGYKHEEIAAMLGITAGGSKAQLHRARQLLREALS